ncbi:microtubule-associated tumor suppressor 1 homolog A isoform X1 [Carassius carassius]|uniref:microtubule-associated tumor suppressor 1 homolog A isoform X1 n=1 Tax=Carassius carassius TaxID=217509 RepID=UPI0028690E0D|nr:microtubule-associated tumor suppressor 1 homolog A isoform X1 [Carassius carassius]XP_059371531.1 microtubule-associated tumor suppressor 1 homolog A isoform X1 [Carassius carassius]
METTSKSMNLTFSIEDKNGNNITCPSEPSPDSLRGSSNLSCGGSDSPLDVEMEDCITRPTKDETTSSKVVKSNRVIAVDFESWNENMALLMIVDTKNTECNGSDRSSETSPDCGEQELSEVDSREPSGRGSSENCCSVSSGEMVMRGSSFVLHENDQPLSVSLISESRTSLDISSDLGVVSGMLPDVCEGLAEVPQAEPKNQGLECTYIQANNKTFLIDEKSLSNEKLECVTPVHYQKFNVQKLVCNSSGSNQSTPVEGKTVLITASEDLDISGNAQTSTPVQSVNNKTFCLPSLSESPLNKVEGDSVSPMAQFISQQQGAASQKSKTPLISASKSKKIEIKRFPKPNFSSIKSKIMSRATNPFKTSSTPVPKSSSISIPQTNESQTTDQHKSPPTKSTSAAITSTSATPARNVKICNAAKRTLSSCQESGPASKSRPRRWSESATSSKTSKDGTQEKNSQVNGVLNNLVTPQKNTKGGAKSKPVETQSNREDSQGNELMKVRGKNQKVSLLPVSARPAAACEWSRSRLGSQPSPARTGGASAAHVPAANLRPPLSASKLKRSTAGKDGSSTSDMPSPRSKLSTSDGASAVSGSQSRSALFAAPASASKLPVKSKLQTKSSSTSQTNGYPKQDHAEPPVGTLSKPPPNRTTLLRTKLQYPPTRSVSSGSERSSGSPLKTPTTTRPMRPAPTVDKNKSRTSSRNQQPPTNAQPDLVPPESKSRNVEYYKTVCEKKNQTIQQLENLLRSNNRRFEAVAVVIKHLCAGHEETMKQRRELSQELVTLREELVSSAHSCERLEQEKEELRAAFDGVLQKVQEQHRSDLTDLEERLKTFYSTEWEKVHQTYQEEADNCKAQMEQQLKELREKHEALKKELEVSHMEEVDGLKLQFEETFKELRQSHEKEMQTFNATLKESEDTLSNRIQELMMENNNLKEKLDAEVKRRKALAEKTEDSHTLYLEQELESLKVVLDLKNKQIHEQNKKLMQIDKLMERNVKLDECLKKLQQENEDLKARMDRHAALSRQLSTEQAVLQETLQKESKVNKRLSMENEELLWKLHNGDLSSPRKVSPSPSLNLQSPRNSAVFSSPPVSPR